MAEPAYHIPALLKATVDGLDIRPDGIYADATFGGGGHSRAIMSRLGPDGRLLSFDRDIDALANSIDDSRFTFVHSDFRYIENFMHFHGIDRFDGVVADLGVSFHHFDEGNRGFSFRTDAPLDMRMNQGAPVSAATIVADYPEERLTALFRNFTDLKRPGALAKALVKAREKAPVDTTFRLAEAVAPALNPRQEKKDLAQVFQALRIETNGEMEALRRFLEATLRVIRPGGRLAVLTYHSIEDRMVKNFLRAGNTDGIVEKDFFGNVSTPWKLITSRPITPSQEEIDENPRARSAKLRVAQLTENNDQKE